MMRQVVTRWIAVANDGEHHCIHYGNPNNGLSYHKGWVHVCDACLKLFDKRFRADGWHLAYKEKGNVK